MTIRKILAVFVILLCIPLIILVYQHIESQKLSPREQLFQLWHNDINRLQKSKALPSAWNQIKIVNFIGTSPKTNNWLEDRPENLIATNADGNYSLTITLTDWNEPDTANIVVQYELFELNSENKVWELGRKLTIPLN